MQIYGKIQVEKRGVESTTCDTCEKRAKGEPDGWVHVSFGHNDWPGAGEEYDGADACSAKCLIAVLKEIADKYEPLYPHHTPTLSIRISTMGHGMAKDLGNCLTDSHG